MHILIGADLVPTNSNKELFSAGDVNSLLGENLQKILDNADYRIFNLEVPLVDKEKPIDKCGPALIAPTDTVKAIKDMHIDLLTLANNHIMDQGEQGLASTCAVLDSQGIAYVGAGTTLGQARQPYVFSCNNKTIGVYACAEHEFSIVTDGKAGANPYDSLNSFDHVASMKENCDYIVVLYHGGKEHYRYPSPELQRICRKFVDKGANLVVCQHSHCIGCKEEYNNGMIVYGQGNFLFDMNNSEYWQTSLLIQLADNFQVSFIPLEKRTNTVRLAEGKVREDILAEFNKRSENIKKHGFVENEYSLFAQEMQQFYLLAFSGIDYRNFFFRVINRITGGQLLSKRLKKKYQTEKMLALRNFIECEAHRELFLRGLMQKKP